MRKIKKPSYLWLFITLIVGIIFCAAVVLATTKSKGQEKINFPYNISFEKPAGWKVVKKPLRNQVIFTNDQKGDSRCFINVFAVRPDRDYSFGQWLGTTIGNQAFLQNAKETTYTDKTAIMGMYHFYDENINAPANLKRAILKKNGTWFDITLSYLSNQDCSKDYQTILSSVYF
ncbi:hypothetical protein HY024_02430 [Candidatus Curtissbacteria bacterium]|nr:hypothetical protein [Candidatus Curtissbacteria bacterium]